MRKNIVKVLSTALLSFSLFSIPASANTWTSVEDSTDSGTYWWYNVDDYGNTLKNQWYYENGNWYYLQSSGAMAWTDCNSFYDYGVLTYTNVGTGYRINDKLYFFDKDGHMLHDCYAYSDVYGVKLYIDSNGNVHDMQDNLI